MRAVNLASKPFINRRPVLRVAVLVWVLGLAFLALNVWHYGDFFRVASSHRSRLSSLEKDIRIEEEQVAGLRRRIQALNLDDNNETARYLNGLIHQRVFPWSRLFDEIEDILPKDVFLTGLSPKVEKVEKSVSRNKGSSSRSKSKARKKTAKKVSEKDLDRVELALDGYARTEEAMLELVDRLYSRPTFLEPVLSFESRDDRSGLINFKIDVVYLTRAMSPPNAGAAVLEGAEGEGAEGEGAAPGDRFAAGSAGAGKGATPRSGGSGAAGTSGDGDEEKGGALYGQPGFPAPQAPGPRPGFGASSDDELVDSVGRPATGGRNAQPNANTPPRRGAAPGQAGSSQPGGVLQPGFTQPGNTRPGGSDTVVPPRRSPGSLQPAQSSSPRLGGG